MARRAAPSTGGVAGIFGGDDDKPAQPSSPQRHKPSGGVAALFSGDADDDDDHPRRAQRGAAAPAAAAAAAPAAAPSSPRRPQPSSSVFGGDDDGARPMTRVNAPGGTGGGSRVSDILTGAPEPHKTKILPQAISSISFAEEPRQAAPTTSTRVNAPGGTGGKSSSLFGGDDEPARPMTKVNAPGGTGGQSSVAQAIGDRDGDQPVSSGRKLNAAANQNQSHFSLGDMGPPPTAAPARSSAAANQNQSHFTLGDAGAAAPAKAASSAAQFHQASHFTIGGADDAPARPMTKVNVPGGMGGQSSVSLSDAPQTTGRRMAAHNQNQSSWSVSDSPSPTDVKPAVRSTGRANEQTFNLADDRPAEVKTTLKVSQQPGGEAHMHRLGSDDVKYETTSFTGLGEDAKAKKETKRIMQPPGGGSSIIF